MEGPVCVYQVANEETVLIYRDDDPLNPRTEYAPSGHMICWHPRYALGDAHTFTEPKDFDEWWQEHGAEGMCLPLYLYDHSGLTMRVTSFSCSWDSGQVGWIYLTSQEIREIYGPYTQESTITDIIGNRPDRAMRDRARSLLIAEVVDYDYYLRGEIYGFERKNKHGEILDSCYGFRGYDITENGMCDHFSPEITKAIVNAKVTVSE